jgi:hypothetical protein
MRLQELFSGLLDNIHVLDEIEHSYNLLLL